RPTDFVTLSLHDALPIFSGQAAWSGFPLERHAASEGYRDEFWSRDTIVVVVAGSICVDFRWSEGRRRFVAEADRIIIYPKDRLRSEEHTSELQSPDHLVC